MSLIGLILAITTFITSNSAYKIMIEDKKEIDRPNIKIEYFDVPLKPEEPMFPVIDISEEPTEIERKLILTVEKAKNMTEDNDNIEEEPEIDILNIEEKYKKEIPYIAKTVWGEARGCSKTEQAAVIWCILNRVDSSIRYMPDDIISVITQKNQFSGYSKKFPVTDNIRNLVIDVLTRWEMEKSGVENIGRILPSEYLWFHGDGRHNHFRDSFRGGTRWDWSLESPYE